MSTKKVAVPEVNFEVLKKAITKAENNQKRISATLKRSGVFDRDSSIENALRQIEKVQQINAAVWGEGFEEERGKTLAFMWECVGRIQDSKAPTVEPENAESWTGADREAYENAVFITLEEAEREGI